MAAIVWEVRWESAEHSGSAEDSPLVDVVPENKQTETICLIESKWL